MPSARPDPGVPLPALRRDAAAGGVPDATSVAAAVHSRAGLRGSRGLVGLAADLTAEIVGAGPLEPLLRLEGVTDVLVNGPGPAWIDRGRGLERTEVVLPDEGTVRRLAQRVVGACGRRLDDATPWADARLPDGTRVHAVLPPLSPQGTCLSLRVPPRRTFTLAELVHAGTLSAAGADLLARIVRSGAAFVLTGGTGSGKTTVLSSLLSLVPDDERIVIVEDASELRPSHPHVVRLESRLPNAEGAGAVDMSTLVRQALRMRPDRLVVGEVRGAEVVELLAALNTGHRGGCGTVHANRPRDLPARLEALCALAGLPRDAAHSQVAAALDVVVHMTRGADGRRVVAGVGVVVGDAGLVRVEPAVRFGTTGVEPGPAHDRLADFLAVGPSAAARGADE